MKKKVLIIAYYWPPSGGSGVQRWLKFVKYLPAFGWQPFVFTPENPTFAIRDESLQKDVPAEAKVIRFPIWEPYDTFFKISRIFGGNQLAKPTELVSTKKRSLFQRLSTWIRGNLILPDPRRFWVKPSVNFLSEFLEENEINVIVTTGPPHSMHLIGLKLKQKNPALRWLADFRDPWSEWGFLDSLSTSSFARKYHRRLEGQVLSLADEIITITPFYARRFTKLSHRPVTLLTNGFDEDDFRDLVYTRPEKFLIRHVGIVNEKCDPRPFMEAVMQLAAVDSEFGHHVQLEFVGEVHPHFREFVSASPILNAVTRFAGNIPHKELLKLYGGSSLLLLILTGYKDAEGYMPGKLFEYMATGLPILAVGPVHGDAAALLKETGAGEMIDSANNDDIKKSLAQTFRAWQRQETLPGKQAGASKYSRREVTGKLVTLFTQDRP